MKRSSKIARNAGFGGCLPSLVFAVSATTASINYNLIATFISLAFGIFGVMGLISAASTAREERKGEDK
jgi:hypothetical protein